MPGLLDLFPALAAIQQQPNPGGNVRSGAPGAAVTPPPMPPGAPPAPISPGGAPGPPGPGNAAPGGNVGAGNAPPATPPEPKAYQTPQDLGQMYLQLVQQQSAREGFWKGIGGMDAALYPGRQRGQAQLIAGIGQPSETAGDMFSNLMRLQGFNLQNQVVQQQMQNFQDMLKPENITTNAAALHMTPTQYVMSVKAAGPEGVGGLTSKIVEFQQGMGMNPAMLAQTRAEAARDAAGQPLDWDRNDPTSFAAYQQRHQLEIKDATEFKNAAIPEYDSAMPDIKKLQDTIGKLKANMPATIYAIQHPAITSGYTGWGANALSSFLGQTLPGLPSGVTNQQVLDARNNIDFMNKQNYQQRFAKSKNIRNQSEASNITGSASNVDNYNNSPDQIQSEFNRMGTSADTMEANTLAAAGKEVPSRLAGLVNPQYMAPKWHGEDNPWYNGATVAKDQPTQGAPTQTGGRAPTAAERAEFDARVKAGADPERMKANAAHNGVIF